MTVRAHTFSRNPNLGKALMFSAVGHSVALVLLLVSPRWFPVPDTSASTMNAIEVQLFSAIVSGSGSPEPILPPARDSTEDMLPPTESPTRRAEAPKPEPKPASLPPVEEPKLEKVAAPSPNASQVAKAEEPLSVTVPANEPELLAPQKPSPVQVAKAEEPLPVTVPANEPELLVPQKPSPVQVAKVDSVPVPKPEPPKVSVKKAGNTLLDSIKAGMNVPTPMVPVAPLPEAPKMARLSDMPAAFPETLESPEILERVQETVKEALKGVAVPSPTQRLVPIQKVPNLAKLADISEVHSEVVASPETQERVREMVQDTLKDISIPSPAGPSALTREVPELAKLADLPGVFSEVGDSTEAKERVHEVVDEVLKTAMISAPLPPVVPAPAERRKLVELPDISPIVPFPESADAAYTKEQVQAAVTRALEEIEIPSRMEDSELLNVAALPPSASLAPSVHFELRVIRKRNDAVAEEQVTVRQKGADSDSFGSPSTMQQDAHWKKAFARYAGRVKTVINRNWHWQGDNLELSVMLSFRIYPDGTATRVAIAKTSGNQIFDRAAIRAVRQLKRLPPFPADIQKEFLDVEMDFSKVRAS